MIPASYSLFSLDICDRDTGFLVHEVYLERFERSALPRLVLDKMIDLKGNNSVALDPASLLESVPLREELAGWTKFPIRLRHELSCLPYRVHGGREYDLMVKGLKPLSVFTEPPSELADFLVKYFDPMVERHGWIAEKSFREKAEDAPTKYMYALPGEAWRIKAYRLMSSAAQAAKWNDALEFIEGSLLGYTSEQSARWFEYRRENGLRWGLQTMYRFVTNEEIGRIESTGRRAFLPNDISDDSLVFYWPHHSSSECDPRVALSTINQMPLARFFAPMVRFVQFSRGIKAIAGVEFEVFELPQSQLATLNQAIDGMIEIIHETVPLEPAARETRVGA